MNEERRWELLLDTEFISSGTEDMVLAGFLDFSDGTMCVCLHGEDSCVSEVSGSSEPQILPDEGWDLDEIPF